MLHNVHASSLIINICSILLVAWIMKAIHSGRSSLLVLAIVFKCYPCSATSLVSYICNTLVTCVVCTCCALPCAWWEKQMYCSSLTLFFLSAVRASVLRHQAWPAAPPDDQGMAAGPAQAAHLSPWGTAELWITTQTQTGLWQRAHQGCHDNWSLDIHWRGQHR